MNFENIKDKNQKLFNIRIYYKDLRIKRKFGNSDFSHNITKPTNYYTLDVIFFTERKTNLIGVKNLHII